MTSKRLCKNTRSLQSSGNCDEKKYVVGIVTFDLIGFLRASHVKLFLTLQQHTKTFDVNS